MKKHHAAWKAADFIPTETIPRGDKTDEPLAKGLRQWAELFSSRQLLGLGVLVEELQRLRQPILKTEGKEFGEAVIHLLALIIDKFANYNSVLGSWHASHSIIRSVFDRHDFSFKSTFAEMARDELF